MDNDKIIKLIKIIEEFENKKIGVIGDLILDEYIWGDSSRISPEAPVPVVLVEKETFVPGGAANVANNIALLGGYSHVVGIVGMDKSASKLECLLKQNKINTLGIVKTLDRPTTKKTRVMARSQQMLRIDREDKRIINNKVEKKLLDYIRLNVHDWDSLIISDYNKGLITKNLGESLVKIINEHNMPFIVDCKPKQVEYFKGATLIKPNYKEASEIAGINSENINDIGKTIQSKLNCNVLMTLGSRGMAIFEKNNVEYFDTKAKEVYDVSGAGDTVGALTALSLASKATLEEAAHIANHAAGIVVGKLGTATLSLEELKYSLENDKE